MMAGLALCAALALWLGYLVQAGFVAGMHDRKENTDDHST